MIKKKLVASAVVLLLFFTVLVATASIKLAQANPNPFATLSVYAGDVPAPYGAKPPEISLLSPTNQSCHSTNNIAFSVNVSFSGKSPWYTTIYGLDPIYPSLREVYFEADWLESNISTDPNQPINLTLKGIPEGKHTIAIYAVGWSPYQITSFGTYINHELLYYNGYTITSCLSITFTVDTVPPQISVISLENKSHNTADIPLNFNVNEAVTDITYSLDGQENMTITDNTTLTGLANGYHNLTVYARDEAGNTGVSETIHFSVDVPFPTILVVASIITVAVVIIGLLVYFKKRKH